MYFSGMAIRPKNRRIRIPDSIAKYLKIQIFMLRKKLESGIRNPWNPNPNPALKLRIPDS